MDGGADVNSKCNDKCTALMWAADRNYKSIVTLLVNRGADINYKDKDGETALIYAAKRRNRNALF